MFDGLCKFCPPDSGESHRAMGRRSKSTRILEPEPIALQAAHLVDECDSIDDPGLMPAAKRQRTGKQAGGTKKQPAPRRNQEDDVQDATTAVDAIIMTAAQPEAEEVEETGAVDVKGLQRKGGASRDMEKALWAQGYAGVCGLDEAGRGPWAGPVVAGACVLPPGVEIPGLNDSKQLKEYEREALYEVITNTPGVLWAVAEVDSQTIDSINILQASLRAMAAAAGQLPAGAAHYYLVDGTHVPKDLGAPAEAVVKGDAHVTCIAAASILAKVTRDRLMAKIDEQYPQFGFAKHKGYGVPAHRAALSAHPPCPVHRLSYKPVAAAAQAWGIKVAKADAGAKSGKGKKRSKDDEDAEEEAVEGAGTDIQEGRGRRGRGRTGAPSRQQQLVEQTERGVEDEEKAEEQEAQKVVHGKGGRARGVLKEVQPKARQEGDQGPAPVKTGEVVVQEQENVGEAAEEEEGGRPRRARKAPARLVLEQVERRAGRRGSRLAR